MGVFVAYLNVFAFVQYQLSQEQIHGEGRASRDKSAGDINCHCIIFIRNALQENLTMKCQRDGAQHPFWRQSIVLYRNNKDITFCAGYHHFRDISIFPILYNENLYEGRCPWSTAFGMMPGNSEYQPH